MPLVRLTDMLDHAYCHNYAVGAFGIVNMDFLEGVMQAAEACRAPVVLNLIEHHFEHYDFDLFMPAVVAAAQRAEVPVAINLDHCGSLESAKRGIRAGCNSVMVDTAKLGFEDNLRLTLEVAEMAHFCGVAVEGQLGCVPEIEGESGGIGKEPVEYTQHAEARALVERTRVDSLAVSVGTVHGRLQGLPKLDFARLAKVRDAAAIPLVIHGGTGLSDEQYRKLIANGVAKINYYTALSEVAAASIKANATSDAHSYKNITKGVRGALRAEVERCIKAWGSSGRAAEVLAQCRLWREAEQVVSFRMSPNVSPEAAAAMMRQCRQALENIPGVRFVRCGVTPGSEEENRHCWLVRLAGPEALAGYRKHPNHAQFIHLLSQYGSLDGPAIDTELSA